jgi:hypothetical protein
MGLSGCNSIASRLPGAGPRTSTLATVSGGHRKTVQPVLNFSSVAWPILSPAKFNLHLPYHFSLNNFGSLEIFIVGAIPRNPKDTQIFVIGSIVFLSYWLCELLPTS